jgi:DHA1 family multidrug resistance protein-like MFS transporter
MPARVQRTLVVMWIGAFLTAASFSLVFPFLPLYFQQMGLKTGIAEWTGVAFAASFLAQAIASPVWGSVADRVGQKPMMIRSGIAIMLVFAGMAVARSPSQIVLLRLMNGALSGFIPASSALLVRIAPRERLGRAMGFLQSAPAAGNIMGPLLGGLLVQVIGIRPTLWAAVGAMTVATGLAAWGVHEPPVEESNRRQRLSPLRDIRATLRHPALREIFLVTIVIQVANTAVEPLITLYVSTFPGLGAVPFWSGLLYSLVGMAAVFASPRWGREAESRGPGRMLRLGVILAGIGNILQVFMTSPLTFGLTRLILIGAGFAAVTPALNLIVARHSAREFQGRAFGTYNSINQIGGMLGPLIGGFWGGALGIRSNFVFTGVLFLATAWLVGPAVQRDGAVDRSLAGASPAAGA